MLEAQHLVGNTRIEPDPQEGASMAEHRVFAMPFAKVYPLYVQKAERKNRTQAEVDRIICWLTGYDHSGLTTQIEQQNDFATFFAQAPTLHPNRSLIKACVRCARRRGRRPVDAKDSLSGQADRRAGQGKSDGKDPAHVVV